MFRSDFRKCFSLVGKGQNILENAKVYAFSKKSVFGKKLRVHLIVIFKIVFSIFNT